MKRRRLPLGYSKLICLVVTCVALANSGCLLIAAGAAGGAALGYAYYQGKVVGDYTASFTDSWAACHTALAELGMPVTSEHNDGVTGYVESRRADGDHVRIDLETEASQVPAEGALTRIGVRVATFGDRPLSERVLMQIGLHLAPAAEAAPPGATLGAIQAGATAPAQQTAPPPLLPTEPVRVPQ
jgi:hypothetical protein